jgi:crotonobetainyl-CoA:carnitine CoA-transferase CaiB-like acyl-CoA transferase
MSTNVNISGAPLDGIVVADFSRVLAGPLATQTLADLGARVIKVERPGSGDDTRSWGPPYSDNGTATYFESVNRNKESITLDLTDPADRGAARALALRADVIVENFKVGTLEKLGLGHDDLAKENPGLITASISGFGSKGGAAIPGYDFVVQAVGGLMHITGEQSGDPMKAGVALVDVLSSLQGALVNQAQAFLGAGKDPGRLGNVHPSIAPYQSLRCADAPLAVACGNDGQFARLCAELGIPELATDERFDTNPHRVQHREDLQTHLEDALAADTAASWQQRLTAVGVPAGKVATIGEGVAYAESLGLDPVLELHDGDGSPVARGVRNPVSWDPPIPVPARAAPALGADNDDVGHWLNDA